MSELIHREANKLVQDAIITMFEIDLQHLERGIFRFSNTSHNGEPVRFNGHEYNPAPIEATGFAWDGAGTMPRPSLSMTAKNLNFISLVVNSDDLVGAPVRRIKTFRKYLDDGTHPNSGISFPVDHFVIERKNSQSRHSLAFELSTKLDQQGTQIPKLMVLRDTCVHTYRYWTGTRFQYKQVACPYVGTKYFKRNGEATTKASEDVCGKRISDCKLRFGAKAVLPRMAFPGVGRY